MKKWAKTLISLTVVGVLVWVLCLYIIDDLLNYLNLSLNPDDYITYWFTVFIAVELVAGGVTVYLLNRKR
ncbi:hypothetical protein L4D08_26050 [Photobacterium chitinilyticum]|uniref:hypothetical protein n=1 Tax=Photobacterium chitinilyticum TaxID=2485123 RepID=UPI003D09D50B